MRNQRDMESFDQLLALLVAIPAGHLFPPDVHGLVTREGYRRLIRNGRRDAVAGGGGEEGGVGGVAIWPRPGRSLVAVSRWREATER
jgi:hypothetical protein